MPEQGLSGLTAAKLQQIFDLTKYFDKKMQIICKFIENRPKTNIKSPIRDVRNANEM